MGLESRRTWILGGACLTLISGCTLSFDLPKASDAAPEQVDADVQEDAMVAPSLCSEGFGSVSENLAEFGDFDFARGNWTNGTSFTHDTNEARLGLGSLTATLSATASRASYEVVPVQSRTIYTISAWVKTEAVTGPGCTMRIRWIDSLGENPNSSTGERLKGTNDWTMIQQTSTSITDAVSARTQIDCGSGTGQVWVDHVWFVEGNGPICGNLNCELDEECFTDCRQGDEAKGVIVDGFDRTPITDRWDTPEGNWIDGPSQAIQSDTGPGLAQPKEVITATEYRTGVQLTREAASTAGSLGLNVAAEGDESYRCLWQPETATLNIVQGATTLETTGAITTAPGYDPDATFAMEASVAGTTLDCCIHGVDGASLSATIASGNNPAPGVVSSDLGATFDSFSVVAP